jgi:hypothetical protein
MKRLIVIAGLILLGSCTAPKVTSFRSPALVIITKVHELPSGLYQYEAKNTNFSKHPIRFVTYEKFDKKEVIDISQLEVLQGY